jgi:hypothetical protein
VCRRPWKTVNESGSPSTSIALTEASHPRNGGQDARRRAIRMWDRSNSLTRHGLRDSIVLAQR